MEAELGSGDDGLLDTVAARLAADGARPAASSSKLARALGLPTEYPGASRRKSVGALITNSRGGRDVTREVLQSLSPQAT